MFSEALESGEKLRTTHTMQCVAKFALHQAAAPLRQVSNVNQLPEYGCGNGSRRS